MPNDDDETMAVKVGTIALTLVAGWVAQKVMTVVWAKVTGHDAPTDLDDDEVGIVSAVSFAAVAAGVSVLARRFAHRGAKQVVARRLARG